MTKARRNAFIALLILGNVVLAGVATYQVLSYEHLSSQNASAQQDVLSKQQQAAQLRASISSLTAQNGEELTMIQALNLTANSLGQQIGLVNSYLTMQNVTTLVANKTITVWPAQTAPRGISPNMTLVLNFTAKYAGYLMIRSNVTTDAFVQVKILFPVCTQHAAICQTTMGSSISWYWSQIIPVLPGVVTVEVGSFAPISPQHAWISIQYIS